MSKEENLDKRSEAMERKEAGLASREESLNRKAEEVEELHSRKLCELERISGADFTGAGERVLIEIGRR